MCYSEPLATPSATEPLCYSMRCYSSDTARYSECDVTPELRVGQLGALSAESYCERILSCANNVLTKGNTLLSHDELEMIVVLRMNRAFMQFMRAHYAAEAKQVFGQTVVRDE